MAYRRGKVSATTYRVLRFDASLNVCELVVYEIAPHAVNKVTARCFARPKELVLA